MKVILKLLSIILLSAALMIGLFTLANTGALDKQIKLALQYYFKINGAKAKFYNLKFKNGAITASDLNIQIGSGTTKLKNIELQTSLSPNLELSIKLMPTNLVVIDENSKLFANSFINGLMRVNIDGIQETLINIKEINVSDEIKDINNKPLEIGSAHLSYIKSTDKNLIECNMNFGNSIKFNISNSTEKPEHILFHAENTPLLFYKIADKMLPNSALLDFLNSSVKNGYIKNADFNINLGENSNLENNLTGTAKILKLDYSYDEEFPTLKSMDVDIALHGTKTQFKINSAYSSEILLSEGVIDMDWQGLDNTTLYIKAIGKGPTKSLTDFIPLTEHESMNKANINLRKIKGTTNVKIYIEIPLKPGSENIYDIRTEIPNASLNIFKNHVKLRKAKISGIFDGNQVKLHGVGKLNEFNTDINFVYNIEDESEFNHKLDIKTHFKTRSHRSGKDQKIAFISLLGGSSILDIEYINKQSKGYITVDSDISNLELYFDKLGIRKGKNVPSRVKINGLFSDPTHGLFTFNTYSNQGLSIVGDVKIENSKTEINLSEIKNKETDISGIVHIFDNEIIAQLNGKKLDLTDADMLQFLEKERDGGDSRLKINIDRVKLKDNIWLDDLKLMLQCDNTRCFSGYIDSKIGSRDIEMLLTAENDREDWLIKCSNAGSFLKGLGAYDSMKSGRMILKISTSRKEVRPGEIIPILDGTFTFERFKLQDTPAITRLVSFVSLPGFISLISGNKDILFSGMNGNFSFENNLLKINNSFATGPYFNFSMKGTIDTKNRDLNLKGHVNPALYGISSIVGSIPIIGRIFTGNKKHRGLVSGTYKIQEKY